MKYKNILITGGAGFIGSNFVRYIKNKYNEQIKITIVDKLTYASTYKTIEDLVDNKQIFFYKIDIVNYKELENIAKDKDLIINFAAETHNDNSLENSEPFIYTNILGTYNLLEIVKKYNIRYHHISTDEVYGDLPLDSKKQFTENSNYNPSSPYSSTKASSDMLVKAWIRSYKIKATISNCSNNFGPYQHIEKFIPRQITNILQNKPPVLYGEGLNIRDWLYVDDHSKAIDLIVDKGKIGDTYLIGTNNEKKNIEILKKIVKHFNLDEDIIKYVPDRLGHDLKYSINSSKLYNELGYQPEYRDFYQKLKETIEWYKNNQEWWKEFNERNKNE